MRVRRILLDTNVVLDVLLDRKPWVAEASALWEAVDLGRLTAAISATTITDVYYVARRSVSREKAREAITLCLATFLIAGMDAVTLRLALAIAGEDYKDDVQVACTQQLALDAIVTRDAEGFLDCPTSVLTPAQCLALLTP